MDDIRLKTAKWTFGGREWELTCNMNVLADVQALYGGDLTKALEAAGSFRTVLDFLACMMNDYADTMGWQARYTSKDLGRLLDMTEFQAVVPIVSGLLTSALASPEAEDEGEESKN